MFLLRSGFVEHSNQDCLKRQIFLQKYNTARGHPIPPLQPSTNKPLTGLMELLELL